MLSFYKNSKCGLKQQNLPIKIHKYKKTFSKIPQKEKRFIPSRSQSCRSPLSPKKNKATAFSFLQSRGEPRYSANAESKADSTIAKVAKHDFATIKSMAVQSTTLKAL